MAGSMRDFGPSNSMVYATVEHARIDTAKDGMLVRRMGLMLSVALLLAGCASSRIPPTGIVLAHVAWCAQPTIAFQDDGVTPAATLTDWAEASPLLGFVPVLPARVPNGACLVSAGGVVRDAVFGGRFTIIYALPQAGALSIAETPSQQSIPTPQCSAEPTSTSTPLATCQQTVSGLNVTVFSSLTVTQIRALLMTAQPAADWVPLVPAPASNQHAKMS